MAIKTNQSVTDTLYQLYNQKGRRRVPRRPMRRRIGILVAGEYYLATSYEIGEGGMLVDCSVPLNKDDRLVITIRMPGVMQGVIMSKVVYILQPASKDEPIKYGLVFENVEFELKRQVRNFVAANTGEKVDQYEAYTSNRN